MPDANVSNLHTVKDLSLQAPPTLLVHGKGQKSRFVPLTKQAVDILNRYIGFEGMDKMSVYANGCLRIT